VVGTIIPLEGVDVLVGEVEHPWGKGRFLADAISDMHVLPVRQADEKSEVEKLLEVVSTQIFCNKVGPSTSSFGKRGKRQTEETSGPT